MGGIYKNSSNRSQRRGQIQRPHFIGRGRDIPENPVHRFVTSVILFCKDSPYEGASFSQAGPGVGVA